MTAPTGQPTTQALPGATASADPPRPRVAIVVLTYNRREELIANLRVMARTQADIPIVVVDNHSTDGTAAALARHFPGIQVLRTDHNMGAAARNVGVQACATPYVAFCDDDTCWAPGALARAADILDAHPGLAIVSGKVLVGAAQRVDPTCEEMARSPLGRVADRWPVLLGFMAGACVARRSAFLDAGGYEPRFFLGAEETLLCLDLVAVGWRIAYADEVATHHYPSAARDARRRGWLLARNAIWVAWLRLPVACAWRETVQQLRLSGQTGLRLGVRTVWETLLGMPWVLPRRRVVPDAVAAMWRRLHGPAPNASTSLPAGPSLHGDGR
ncbi:glycosyltransferase family 2 protein [Achromobacter aloeverae]|uniref:Glycosyl transferase family 2 n=1 Tax=Achromobacter aloeverae TaxID=1750518 RepID=A0A4Q1HHV7_9BURK|nr:glycosyltransferase [Achromobacter aloeverae]RXN86167.1 glycosyl transferase family 2 [Achromobacter aloeverae]